MKRFLGTLTATMLLAGPVAVATSTTASAATTFGPYRTSAECTKARANTKAPTGATFSKCTYLKTGWYFTVS